MKIARDGKLRRKYSVKFQLLHNAYTCRIS